MTEKKETIKKPIMTITQDMTNSTSRAKKIKRIIYKQKKWMGSQKNIDPVKEPVMFFERRNGDVEFYEDVTAGAFEFQHSDGEKRFIIIVPSTKRKFGFGNHAFQGYIAHEDYPLTGRPDPHLTTEQMNMLADKVLNDMKKWKAKEREATGNMWWKILGGIAVIILAYGVFKTLSPQTPPTPVEQEIIKNVTENATRIIQNVSATVFA